LQQGPTNETRPPRANPRRPVEGFEDVGLGLLRKVFDLPAAEP
jgi:hypothetical protein